VAKASRRAEQFAATWRPRYPAAADCLLDDFELLTAHLHHPRAHWPRIRHTNLIEPTFGQTRRQVKVMGRLPGQRSALSLVWAVLDRAVAGWRGITYTPANTRQLQTIRRELAISRPRPKKEPATPDAVAVTPAA
jgi:transposase-like protein